MKTICKSAVMKNCYPLSGGYISSRNFWNNKAAVIECKGGYMALQSYGTIVAVLYRGKFYRTWCGYSVTTMNHIRRFCQMYGGPALNKATWKKLHVYDTSIEPLKVKYLQDIGLYRCDYFKRFKIVFPEKVGV